jgi:YD repeat-containing protein
VCGAPGLGPISYTYDSLGNVLSETDALGNTARFTYDPVFNHLTSATGALQQTSSFYYDPNGNLTKVTDPNGHSAQFAYAPGGLLSQVTDPLGNNTAIARDNFGNPTSVTDAQGNTSTALFDLVSRPVLAVDAMGRRSTTVYDALNRVTSVTDPRGNKVTLSYDGVGNLLSLTDQRGNSTGFTYDNLGNLVSRTTALGEAESWQFDLADNLIQYSDRLSHVSNFQYDTLNRLVQEQYLDGSIVTRTYDPYSRTLSVNDSAGGLFTFAYDANGLLLSQNEPNGTVQYTRDALGRVATEQVAGQNPVNYSYDPAGNLLSAASSAVGVTLSWDARNLPATISRTNGLTTTYRFDTLSRLQSLVHAHGASALNTQSYGYDRTGRRTSASNDLGVPPISQAASATVDAANELLLSGATAYTQDLNGNRLTETSSGGAVTYAWDSRKRLTTAFKYDSGRNLTEIDKTVNGATTSQRFVFDSLTNVVSLTDASGLPVSVLTGRTLDSHFASVDSSGNVAFGIGDPANSTGGITNGAGAITARSGYDPYGARPTLPRRRHFLLHTQAGYR